MSKENLRNIVEPTELRQMSMKKLNIGITCYPTVGGSGIVATELGLRLAEKGHQIHFITSSLPFRLRQVYPNVLFHEVEVNQYQVFRYPPYDLSLASKMAEVSKTHHLDLLHVHYAVPHAVCAALAKDMTGGKVKVMTTLHGTDITVLAHDPALKNIIRYGIDRSDAVTAVSDFLTLQTKELLGIERDIETVYNFVAPPAEIGQDRNELKKGYGIETDEKVLVHMSNFRPVKRVEDVVRAFQIVRKSLKSKLILIGDGPERHRLEPLVEKLGLRKDVLFLGNQSQIYDLLAIGDVMFLLSEKESFGLAALESMVVGVPVVGTRVGGIPEVVTDGETGILCDPYDYEAAGKAALELLRDERKRKNMGTTAKTYALRRFAEESIVSKYEKLYEKMLANQKK